MNKEGNSLAENVNFNNLLISGKFLYELKTFILEVTKLYPIKFAYLFGSQSRGTANDKSDIDIAVYFEGDYDPLTLALIRGNIIEHGKEFFKKNVDIVSLNDASLLLRYEIIHDGIVILDNDFRGDFESLSLRMYFDFKYYSDIYDEALINRLKQGDF